MGFKEKLQKNSHKSREKKLRQETEKIHGELYISLWQIDISYDLVGILPASLLNSL